jgi:predicted RecA/RadA family phage recombinase
MLIIGSSASIVISSSTSGGSGNIFANGVYFGPKNSDGTWLIIQVGSGATSRLSIQCRISGTYQEIMPVNQTP